MCDINDNPIKLSVKWNGKEFEIPELSPSDSVAMLKVAIENATGVRPERQKLLNVKFQGKVATDNYTLSELHLKPNLKIMMMGSLEEAIAGAQTKPDVGDEVVNDLDIEEEEVDVENQEIYLAKINKRVRDYKINVLNQPRDGKKLLVLDIDYTLFDHRSVAETGYELMRPFLHEFLTSAYEDYDIVIWSATGMKWIEEKMRLLGVSTHQQYKIMFYLDYLAMITVHTAKYGTIDLRKSVVASTIDTNATSLRRLASIRKRPNRPELGRRDARALSWLATLFTRPANLTARRRESSRNHNA